MVRQSKCPNLTHEIECIGEPTPVHMVQRPGSKVRIGPSETDCIEAMVNTVCLKGDGVSYEVVWWSGNERRTAWVYECELIGMQMENMAVLGFVP